MPETDPRPIGVFDSGVGGLTVLSALWRRLPGESTVYLGDTARVPYGTRSEAVVRRYAQACAGFLLKQDIKLLVIACNTVSAFALETLQRSCPVPVVGVIEPGAQAALEKTQSGHVGVIGTEGTVRSGAYQRALEALKPSVRVSARACPLFVPLAEEGWTVGEVPALAARHYLSEWAKTGPDALVLGCTHYPLLRAVIAEAVGPRVALVDASEATAVAVKRTLVERRLFAPPGGPAVHRFFVTDSVERFTAVAERFLGAKVTWVEQVDLTA